MSERAAFISAILDKPDDDTVRLVFADWLEEHGEDARAEFIRTQIAVARLPRAERHASGLSKHAAELLAKHEAEWRQVIPAERLKESFSVGRFSDGLPGIFKRGFLEYVAFHSVTFPEFAGPLLTLEPASVALFLSGGNSEVEDRLAADPRLRAVVNMHTGHHTDCFARLIKSPHLVNLREIDLSSSCVEAEHVNALADAPAAFQLQWLSLCGSFRPHHGRVTPDAAGAVKILATAPRFASLKYLGLASNDLGDEIIKTLLASKTLPRMMWLELDDNYYDKARFAKILAERFTGGSYGGEE